MRPAGPAIYGYDHAFLAQLSFASASDLATPRALSARYRVDRETRTVDVTLDTVDGVRLPTPVDQYVFLGLLQLDQAQEQPAGPLLFRRRELFETLGWEDRKDGYERLQAALQRLQALRIKPNAEPVSRTGRPYDLKRRFYHLLKAYHLSPDYNGQCRVDWGPIVIAAGRLNDFRRLDWALVRALGNPLTVQLYRLLDRLPPQRWGRWAVHWRSLATLLGMADYQYSSRLWLKLKPHVDRLVQHGALARAERRQDGTFVFHLQNYLRTQLWRVLGKWEFKDSTLAATLDGYDEADIMLYVERVRHGHVRAGWPQGWLDELAKQGFGQRYPEDEAEAFCELWNGCDDNRREAIHQAGVRLLRLEADPSAAEHDPAAWHHKLRAVCRFILFHQLDPDRI